MNWRSIAARATRETADDAEELLWSAGAVSVSVEDAGDNPLYEPGPGDTPLWEHVVVTGLFEDDVDAESVREQLAAGDFTLLHVDEVADRLFQSAGQVIVLEQDAVLEGLVPAFDLALCLRVPRSTADVIHAFVSKPVCQLS